MVQEAMRIAFEELGLHRMSLGVFSFNTAAIRCYQNAGFIREGIAREAALFGNGYVDCMEMGILDREWGALYRS
jgi:RimJ/RimL family protein N-acetyltransferase